MRSIGLLSNRVKKNTGSDLATERYEYLSLENAEPDFGFPSLDNSVMGSDSNGTRKFFNTASAATPDTLVFRDSNGDFSANDVIFNRMTASSLTITNDDITVSDFIQANNFISVVATGTSPFTVASTTKVDNLNVDLLDGLDESDFLRSNVNDNFTAGSLTFDSGTSLIAVNGATVNFNNVIGTSPFTVVSTTKVDNLNADLFDDLTSIEFTLDRITGYGNSTTNTIDVGSVIAETIVGTNTATSAITQYDLITGTASLTSTISGYETITGTNTATSAINGFNSITVANVVTPQITAATILNVSTGGDITLSTPANITLNATSGAIYTSSPIVDVTGTGSTFTADVINANNTTVADLIADNITTLGYLRGPASFTIDPATHGDDTGTVVVAGSIQVNTNTSISGNLILDGDLTVSGTTTTVSATNLTLSDNMIMLNEPEERSIANAVGDGVNVVYTTTEDHNYFIGELVEVTGVTPSSFNVVSTSITAVTSNTFTIASTVTDTYVSGGTAKAKISANPDLGITGEYDAGSGVVHSGIFRDATDERFKFFHEYVPEPDLSVFIDTTHPSFALANLEVNTLYGVDTELSGQLRGPATFVIDPAAHGNDSGSVQILGSLVVNETLTVSATTGTSPFTIASTTKVDNLNVDLLDGLDESDFLRSNVDDNFTAGSLTFDSGTTLIAADGATVNFNNAIGTAPFTVVSTTKVTNLNADLFDGLTSTDFDFQRATDNGATTTNNITVPDIIANNFIKLDQFGGNLYASVGPAVSDPATDYKIDIFVGPNLPGTGYDYEFVTLQEAADWLNEYADDAGVGFNPNIGTQTPARFVIQLEAGATIGEPVGTYGYTRFDGITHQVELVGNNTSTPVIDTDVHIHNCTHFRFSNNISTNTSNHSIQVVNSTVYHATDDTITTRQLYLKNARWIGAFGTVTSTTNAIFTDGSFFCDTDLSVASGIALGCKSVVSNESSDVYVTSSSPTYSIGSGAESHLLARSLNITNPVSSTGIFRMSDSARVVAGSITYVTPTNNNVVEYNPIGSNSGDVVYTEDRINVEFPCGGGVIDLSAVDDTGTLKFYASQIADTTTSTSTTTGALTVAGGVGIGENLNVSGSISVGTEYRLVDESTTLATITETQIASYDAATFGGAKIVIQAVRGTERHMTELLVVHDGTTASATEYASIYTGAAPLATYNIDITAGSVRVLATSASATSTVYSIAETLMII